MINQYIISDSKGHWQHNKSEQIVRRSAEMRENQATKIFQFLQEMRNSENKLEKEVKELTMSLAQL